MTLGYTKLVRVALFITTLFLLVGIGWHLVNLQHFHPDNHTPNELSSITHSDKKILSLLLAAVFVTWRAAILVSSRLLAVLFERYRVYCLYPYLIFAQAFRLFLRRGLLNPKPY